MRTWLRRVLWGVGFVAVLIGAAIGWGLWQYQQRTHRLVPVPARSFADSSDLARGRYLFDSRGCAECHGANGSGRVFADEPGLRIKGPNLTSGPGGVVQGYTNTDWERAIRHGVHRSGRPLLVMPSEDYARFTDADLAAIVAYIRAMPAMDGTGADVQLPLVARVLYGYGLVPDAASRIDHAAAPATPVQEGLTVEHGRYVAQMCFGCHGDKLSGGPIPGAPPDWPATANLTSGAKVMDRYPDDASFFAFMRSGKRPDGTAVRIMPFDSFRKMSDVDLGALRLYLKTLPPTPTGQH